ncbi:MAG: tRNA lysidine(34) synthetase TilS [Thermomicrobiales bacterium]
MPGSNDPAVVVAAFSGGADSLALVVLLKEFERLGLVRLLAVHVDHGVRPGSDDEARSVAMVARQLEVAFRSEPIGPDTLGRHRGVGLEEAMRRERYRILAGVAAEVGAQAIATGHHRRDQAETVLLHLLRGSGTRGAAGMREFSAMTVPWWVEDGDVHDVTLWRPLLREDPAALRAMVESLGLPIVEDPSNREETYRRNAVRHRVLPLLESVMPGAEGNLAAYADRAAEDDDALDAIARTALAGIHDRLRGDVLTSWPMAIQRRMVRQWIAAAAPTVDLTADRSEAVRLLAERNEGGKAVEIGGGWRVRVESGALLVVPPG